MDDVIQKWKHTGWQVQGTGLDGGRSWRKTCKTHRSCVCTTYPPTSPRHVLPGINAPFLKVNKTLLFVVVPSGKIISGSGWFGPIFGPEFFSPAPSLSGELFRGDEGGVGPVLSWPSKCLVIWRITSARPVLQRRRITASTHSQICAKPGNCRFASALTKAQPRLGRIF